MEATEEKEEEDQEPLELNSFEFFAEALSYFERIALRTQFNGSKGELSSTEQSPANPVVSSNSRVEINSIKTAIIQENNQ